MAGLMEFAVFSQSHKAAKEKVEEEKASCS
jgi:hypothetical protein